MKRVLTSLMLICLLFATFVQALFASTFALQDGDYEYEVSYKYSEARITEYKGSATDITIPSTLGGYPVTSIGDSAFSYESIYQEKLISITIPEGVKTIGDWAFAFQGDLISVTLPDSLETIGKRAFSRCTKLSSITIPASVKRIDYAAFDDCEKLRNVYFEGNTQLGELVFVQTDYETFGNLLNSEGYSMAESGIPVIPLSVTLHGSSGSSIETYAKKNGLKFSTSMIQIDWVLVVIVAVVFIVIAVSVCLLLLYKKKKGKTVPVLPVV